MSDEAIRNLEAAALEFAKAYWNPGKSIQEHQEKRVMASGKLIAAAMECNDDEPAR